jgi:hypothetical protein
MTMCSAKGPTITPVAAEPAPVATTPEKAPQQSAGVRRKPGVTNPAAMAGGTLLTGPSGIQANALNTGAASLLGG